MRQRKPRSRAFFMPAAIWADVGVWASGGQAAGVWAAAESADQSAIAAVRTSILTAVSLSEWRRVRLARDQLECSGRRGSTFNGAVRLLPRPTAFGELSRRCPSEFVLERRGRLGSTFNLRSVG